MCLQSAGLYGVSVSGGERGGSEGGGERDTERGGECEREEGRDAQSERDGEVCALWKEAVKDRMENLSYRERTVR